MVPGFLSKEFKLQMDRETKDQIAKTICYAVGCYIAYLVLMWLLPYLVMCFAIVGAAYLFREYQRNKWRNRR
jgi:hypothetical protein